MPWVLSGCRISSNRTNERKQHVGGDTRRLCKANKGPKGAKGKANRRGYRCAPEGLPGHAQGRQRSDWSSGEPAEREQSCCCFTSKSNVNKPKKWWWSTRLGP